MLRIGRQISILAFKPFIKQNYEISMVNKNMFQFATKTINLPFLADSINQGTVSKLVKKQGQWVDQDQTVADIQTDKVTVQIKSPNAGYISKFHVNQGDNLDVGKPFFQIDTDGQKPVGQSAKNIQQKVNEKKSQQQVKQKEDHSKSSPQKSPKKQPLKQAIPQQLKKAQISPKSFQRKQIRQPLSRLRQKVSQRLKDSQNTYALLTTFQQVDMQEATNVRKSLGQTFLKKYNVKLGFMSFFVKAATLALQEFPVANSVIDGKQIVRRNYVDISIAVATPSGLMVPVLRDCQNLKFHQVEQGINDLAKKGKQGKITLQQMKGGTFTITNGGTFGSLMGTPIINPPQSAILGMHSIINRPIVKDNQIVARPMMYLALTYDHRLLDGKDAVMFLKRIQNLIQDPRRMLLQI